MAATDRAGRTQPPLLSWRRLGDYGLSFLLALIATTRCYAAARAGRDGDWLLAAHSAAVAIALGVSAFLPLLRGAPLAARSGWRPRAIAAIGNFTILPLGALPLTWQPDWLLTATTIGIAAIYGWVVWALLTLRRGFSVFPEARQLTTHGPYGIVRHPLYAAYIVVYVLIALPRFGGLALLVAALGIASEIMRARNEEQVLRSVFPTYDAYAARVPAFVPRRRNHVDVDPPSPELPIDAGPRGEVVAA
jgi:protein-S-isoprenylcysteine O-methyltransferase Ste14